MELLKRNIHMDCRKCSASMETSLEKDHNISDVRPDAVRIIMDKGNVVIEEVRAREDRAFIKGKLQFQILYATDQEGESVAVVDGEVPIDEQIYLAGLGEGDSVKVGAVLEDLTTTLINSRKFNVQALVMLKAECEELKDEEAAVDVADSGVTGTNEIEYRKKPLSVATTVMKKKDIFRMKEEAEIPGSFPNIASLIWYDIQPAGVEFKMQQDKITVQGEVRVFFLYRGEGEGKVCHYDTVIPFAGALDCDGSRESMIPDICCLSEVREVAVRPDFDGEERVFTFELVLNLEINACEEEELEILSDVYGVVKEVGIEKKKGSFRRFLTKSSGKMKLAEHLTLPEEEHAGKVLYTRGMIQLEEPAYTEGGIALFGEAKLQVMYEDGTEKGNLYSRKISLPVQYVLEAEGIDESCTFQVDADLEQISASIVEGSELDCKCVVFFHAHIYRAWTEDIIEEITTSELDSEKIEGLPSLAVYVVREGDSLWDIGKRYYVPVAALREANGMPGNEIKAGDRILIIR